MKTVVLAYVPVIQKGYLQFFTKYADAQLLCIWGDELIAKEASLRKEIRAIAPQDAAILLSHYLSKEVRIADISLLSTIAQAQCIVMPDDAISHRLYQNHLISFGNALAIYDAVFLRWDESSSQKHVSVVPDETISVSQLRYIVDLAQSEASKSSDWWRQVGAVVFARNGSVYVNSHNAHNPTEYSPYISGDPRSSHHKGEHIQLSTATHAEIMVLGWCAQHGLKTAGLSLFTTTFPCPSCARLIAASGITHLYYQSGYSMLDGYQILKDAGITIVRVV